VIQKHQLGTQMPVKRREESIPSVKRTPNTLRVFGSLRAAHSGAPYFKRWASRQWSATSQRLLYSLGFSLRS